jgi:SAM-dependent methyltransferase
LDLGERLLRALSAPPGVPAPAALHARWTVDNALRVLTSVFPTFLDAVRGKAVLDFGCGAGFQCVALARAGAGHVLGIESNPRTLASARQLVEQHGLAGRVTLRPALAPEDLGTRDLTFSQNSMEHFPDPLAALRVMTGALAPDGRIFMTFGPPWFAPYGSHMRFFTPVPWVNLLFRERTVLKVRERYRSDGARRYEDVESGLNRMTIRKFERLIAQAGLRFEFRRYRGVKRLDPLTRVLVVRELFVNEVNAILVREAPSPDRNAAAQAAAHAEAPSTRRGMPA